MESTHLSVHIDHPADDVYTYAADPLNLPAWASGLGGSVELVKGQWIAASSPMGRVEVTFAPRNDFGVLDHEVTLPGGESVLNPMRVIADDEDSCEVIFTLRRRPEMTPEDFRRDAETVAADLATLKGNVERG